ncbi:MAG: hypothetical protein JXL84_26405 [Deltaproteobacteria bacterium]|nr:hypothetical protein [Deltaproteobacteria bacterium]
MGDSARLGGFKILKDVCRIALASPNDTGRLPVGLFRVIAENRINLPYLTLVSDSSFWGVNIVVEAGDLDKICRLIEEIHGKAFTVNSRSAILSVFPHRRNPDISGRLFEAFDQQGLEPEALANSPSAISVVVTEELISSASRALFEPFSFGAYRTPEDWKLAQKGKEQLYKEVVASYQEKKPGVYGLECHEAQEFIRMKVDRHDVAHVGSSLRGFARLGLDLTFLASSPCRDRGVESLALCLHSSESETYRGAIQRIAPDMEIRTVSPVMTFSMNGPHFGDRYGIASELLSSLDRWEVGLLALSCTVASITGVVSHDQKETAFQAIQDCFEIPSITKSE